MPKREIAPFEGRAVRLRLLEPTDLPRTLTWRNQDENRRWFVHSEPIQWEDHVRWYRNYQERDDDFVFIAEDLEQTPSAFGQAALYKIDWDSGSAEFGRLLIGEPAARGRGLGGEITKALLGFGFGTWTLRRIVLEVFAHNTRAIDIYRSCGFESTSRRGELLSMELMRKRWTAATSLIDQEKTGTQGD